jgi:hypothetical protein
MAPQPPANFDEAVIDSQLARRQGNYSGVFAPQYGRGPVPPPTDDEPDEPLEAA